MLNVVMEQQEPLPPVEIAPSQISEEALMGLIESFILREGTDYGLHEVSMETKKEQIRRQLNHGDVRIVFDPATESVTLLTKRELERLTSRP